MKPSDVFAAFKSPLAWCFGLFLFTSQVSLFCMTNPLHGTVQMYSAESPLFYHFVAACVCAALLVTGHRRGTVNLAGSSLATVLEAVFGIFGIILLSAIRGDAQGSTFFLLGCLLVALSSSIMIIQIQQLFALIGTTRFKGALIAGALIEVVLFAIYPFVFERLEALTAALIGVRGILYWLAQRDSTQPDQSPDATERGHVPTSIMVGIAALVAGWSFLQTQIYMEDASTVTAIVVVTKLGALGVFCYYMWSAHDLGFASAGKVICLAVSCAIALHLGGMNARPCAAVMDIGYSLFELVAYLALAELSSRTNTTNVNIIAGFYLVVNIAYLLGGGGSVACHEGFLPSNVIETALLIALVVTSVCCFDEKHVASVFLSPISTSGESLKGFPAGQPPIPRQLARFNLTEREEEIALLYAKGRSAVFIAEELQISPHTVRSHMSNVYEKCDVHSRQELLSLLEE